MRASTTRRKCFTLCFLLLALVLAQALPAAAQCDAIPDCALVWSDEFDGTALDLTKWEPMLGDGTAYGLPAGWGNNELEYYQAENATVAGGFLTITAKEEPVAGYSYTSARLRTLGQGDWTFGRMEMRAKLPGGQGFWPAFWMLSTDPSIYGGWAASGEIDILENLGSQPQRISGTIHYGGVWPNNVYSTSEYILPSGSFHDEFHVFAVEWQAGVIRWYVDGILFATKDDWFSTGGPFPAPFNVDFHILLNFAVGGNLPGPPDSTTVFPAELVVDYVRVYQGAEDLPPTVSITSPADGTNVTPGTDLTITADASDDGAVALVQFFQGPYKLSEDTEAPYEVTVEGVATGCFTLYARAYDNSGLVATSDPVAVSAGTACSPAPVSMRPALLPGTVEAEDFDLGGEGVAYSDSDPSNNGGAYRPTEGVDLESASDTGGGYDVGWTADGEWLSYTVLVTEAGVYDIEARVASESTGGSFYVEMGGVDVTGPIAVPPTGGWQTWTTVRAEDVELQAGATTMRIVITESGFNLNNVKVTVPVGCVPGPVVFDDMEHGNPWGSGWFSFGGAVGGGGFGPNAWDLPPENGGAYSLETGWGSGGVPGFFGGFGRTYPVDLSTATHFSFWINPDAGQDFTLEINLQDDDNGDNAIPYPATGDDDEFQYNCVVSPTGPCAVSGGGWQLVSIPLADFFDDNSYLFGGNGVLDAVSVGNGGNGQLISIAVAVISNSGADATFRTDYWTFYTPEPSEVVFDDMDHCDPWGNGWFSFFGAGGGGFAANGDLPPAYGGVCSLETGWGGGGPGYFGGFGRTFPVDLYSTTHFGFWIDPDPDQDYTLEINFQDDDDADGIIPSPPNGGDDEFQFNCTVSDTGPCAVAGGGWQFVSIPLADLFDDNSYLWGGNGIFDAVDPAAPRCGNGKLINVVIAVISHSGAPVTFRTDYWTFTDESLDAEYDRVPDVLDNCPADPNTDQADFDGDGEGDVCDTDDDGDGVGDGADLCPWTPAGELVDGDGCSIDQYCPCDGGWRNHGKYVSCVAHAAGRFVRLGLLTEAEKCAIVSSAAHSSCGR